MLQAKNPLIFSALLLFCSCNAMHTRKTVQLPAAAAPAPMSCKIKGKIVSIINTLDTDAGSVCAKYPCRAQVLIVDVVACGSSVSAPLHTGDTVEMQFAYTLANTSKAIPAMTARYPGLKKGSTFVANAEQRLKPGQSGDYVIYGYELAE